MIKHFKFWLMVIGAFFFVACNGTTDSSDTSASSLIEGKTFYSMEAGSNSYSSDSFNDGYVSNKSYNLATGAMEYADDNVATYTFSGNKMTYSEIGGSEVTTVIIASTSNGVSLTNDTNSSKVYYFYNTIADAKSNPNK